MFCFAGKEQQAQGLDPALHLSEGARDMLKKDLWTEKGWVNGALGFVRDIIYAPNFSTRQSANRDHG